VMLSSNTVTSAWKKTSPFARVGVPVPLRMFLTRWSYVRPLVHSARMARSEAGSSSNLVGPAYESARASNVRRGVCETSVIPSFKRCQPIEGVREQ